MADKKVGSEPELKVEKVREKKEKWTVTRILTTAVIVLLAFLMVGGTFYYILTPGFRKSANAFGFYDGEPIVLENGNVFGRTLMADPAYVQASQDGNYTQILQSMYSAYQLQVIYTALAEEADRAKITAPVELVNKGILDAGIYSNDEGVFDAEIYNRTHPLERKAFFQYVQSVTPYQVVLKDCGTALVPEGEKTFIAELNTKLRDFSYFNVDFAVYPDKLAKDYAKDKMPLFDKMDLSIISCSTEESAKKAYEALKEKTWSEVVEEYSEDNYKYTDGYFGGSLFVNAVAQNVVDDADMVKIRALTPDTYTEPIKGPYSYAIYKLNKPIENADLSDKDTMYYVKSLLYSENKDEVQPYIDEAVSAVSAIYSDKFESAASKYNLDIVDVDGIGYNAAQSSFAVDAIYADGSGFLASALSQDADLYKNLFTGEAGDTFGPVNTDNGTLFVKIKSTDSSSDLAETVNEYYNGACQQVTVADSRDYILSSKKHEDNFTSKFFEIFLKDMIDNGQAETTATSVN